MTIYIASDHAGFRMKEALVAHLPTLGYQVEDFGAYELIKTDDYPDYITPLAKKVATEKGSFGIILGGSGQGEAMCANRIQGAHAVVYYGPMMVNDILEVEGGHSEDGFDIIRLGRKHNNANILSIGARFVTGDDAVEAVRIFLESPFSADPRHARRLAKF